jgi:hypothetical protein
VWNQAGWVAGENFIEVMPRPDVPLVPLLAVLNSGITEIAVRVSAHVYGGGVYNLSPGSIGEVPIVDVRQLSADRALQLEHAYKQFLLTGGTERTALDIVVLEELGLPPTFLDTLHTTLESMQRLSSAILEPLAVDMAGGRVEAEELRLF